MSINLILLVGCSNSPSKLDAVLADPAPDVLPRARMPIVIDGDWGEPAWNLQALRGVFTANGAQARPYSEIRLMRDDRDLFVALYAADEDIRSTDAFELALGTRVMTLHPTTNVIEGVRAGVDLDGTLDKPSDDDEEWVVELAIPLKDFPSGPLAVMARRCDTPKDGVVRCGQWSGTVKLP